MTNHEIEIAIARELQEAAVPAIDAASIMVRSGSEHASRAALLAELDDLQMLFTDLREALASSSAKTALITSRWTALDWSRIWGRGPPRRGAKPKRCSRAVASTTRFISSARAGRAPGISEKWTRARRSGCRS